MTRPNQDEIIASRIATNFPEGFRLLFITYYKPLLRIAEKMIGIDFAEDIVQDTFLSIWNNRQNFDSILSLKSYLYTSIHNKCLNVIRTNQQFEKYKIEESAELYEEYILDEDVISQLYQIIDLLPEHYKKVIIKSIEGESIANIAFSMNTTEDAIKAYKRRAKQILKKELGDKTFILLLLLQEGHSLKIESFFENVRHMIHSAF